MMLSQSAANQIRAWARRARLASTGRQSLELKLTPEESQILASLLDDVLADEQTWFWTEGWQAAEREAEADLLNGRYQDFDTMEDMLLDLGLQA